MGKFWVPLLLLITVGSSILALESYNLEGTIVDLVPLGNHKAQIIKRIKGLRTETVWSGKVNRYFSDSDRFVAEVEADGTAETLLINRGRTSAFFPFPISQSDQLHWSVRSWRGDMFTIVSVDTPGFEGLWVSRESDRTVMKFADEFIDINSKPEFYPQEPVTAKGFCYIPEALFSIPLAQFDSPKGSAIKLIKRYPRRQASLGSSRTVGSELFDSSIWKSLEVGLWGYKDGAKIHARNLLKLSNILTDPDASPEERADAKEILKILFPVTTARRQLGRSESGALSQRDYLAAVKAYANCAGHLTK